MGWVFGVIIFCCVGIYLYKKLCKNEKKKTKWEIKDDKKIDLEMKKEEKKERERDELRFQ